ncbi:hypothetical protein [Flavobacterium pectinovorum]|uniref:hypothetical protein n=1 Tax=Flavobacterium pectinovorum TaxID=29533 RepID=UPI001FAE0A0C|nr:hypothetical protein [Flavobacterium pectinovorum]MCI9844270.1 hypothetical protein [Flavobacterium pectinovorum]
MTKRLVTIFFVTTILLVLLHGVFRIYEVFYPSYFNQKEYTQIAFIENGKMPDKYELLFYGFTSFEVLTVSLILSLIICSFKLIKR